MNRNTKEMILGTPAFGIQQVGGDYGSPWEYGGTWYDENEGLLYHIGGLEHEGVKDTEPDDIEVPDEMVRQIVTDLGGNPDQSWKDADEQQEHYIERDVENAIAEWQYDCAKEEDAKVRLTLYTALARFDRWMQFSLDAQRSEFSEEVWAELTDNDVSKVILVADREGWDHVSYEAENVTKAKLAEKLGLQPNLKKPKEM